MSPYIATAIVETLLFFLAWVINITLMVYIFKASVRRFDIGIPGAGRSASCAAVFSTDTYKNLSDCV